jgi:nitronate monooxygenase
MLVASGAEDIVYTNLITGVHGNYLKPSIRNAGMDPDNLEQSDSSAMSFASDRKKKWKDIWGAGQSVSNIDAILPAGELVARLHAEYLAARAALGGASPLVNPAWTRLAQAA